MPNTGTHIPSTLWVCDDCYMAANGLGDPDATPEPLGLLADDEEITSGLLREEHDDDCDPDDDCECERRSFTWAQCHGCGSQLGGSRNALTVWN